MPSTINLYLAQSWIEVADYHDTKFTIRFSIQHLKQASNPSVYGSSLLFMGEHLYSSNKTGERAPSKYGRLPRIQIGYLRILPTQNTHT